MSADTPLPTPTTPAFDRRAVLKAGAWAAPAVAVAAALPAAAASGDGFELSLEVHIGDQVPMFNATGTKRYDVPFSPRVHVVNSGTTAAPGGWTIVHVSDARVLSVTAIEYTPVGGVATVLPPAEMERTGDRVQNTWVIPVGVPVAGSGGGVVLSLQADVLAVPGSDHFDDPHADSWILVPPSGDLGGGVHTIGDYAVVQPLVLDGYELSLIGVAGSGQTIWSPDGTSAYAVGVTHDVRVYNLGTDTAPGGWTLSYAADRRAVRVTGLEYRIGGADPVGVGAGAVTEASGTGSLANIETHTWVMPAAVAPGSDADGVEVRLHVEFVWGESGYRYADPRGEAWVVTPDAGDLGTGSHSIGGNGSLAPLEEFPYDDFSLSLRPNGKGSIVSVPALPPLSGHSVAFPEMEVFNRGTTPLLAGFDLEIDLDDRVFDVSGLTYAPKGGASSQLAVDRVTVVGTRAKYRWTVPAVVGAGDDGFVTVAVEWTQKPNAIGDDLYPIKFTLTPPVGDSGGGQLFW